MLRLFHPSGPLDFVAIDILGPLLNKEMGNRYIDIVTNRYSKLIKAITSANTAATRTANIFMQQWVSNFGIPSAVLTDN